MVDGIRILVAGGSGSGCSTTGHMLSEVFAIPCIDSDDYFHKPTDPPFTEQYSKEERNRLIRDKLNSHESWILSGSISNWGIDDIKFSHAILLNIPTATRLDRLKIREQERFGDRIKIEGDMYEEHTQFIDWASHYETGTLVGRNLAMDKEFIKLHSESLLLVDNEYPIETLESIITAYINSN